MKALDLLIKGLKSETGIRSSNGKVLIKNPEHTEYISQEKGRKRSWKGKIKPPYEIDVTNHLKKLIKDGKVEIKRFPNGKNMSLTYYFYKKD